MNIAVAVSGAWSDFDRIEDRLSDALMEDGEIDIWVTGHPRAHDAIRRYVRSFKGTTWKVRLRSMALSGRPALVLVYGNVQDPTIDPAVIEWMATSAKVETLG